MFYVHFSCKTCESLTSIIITIHVDACREIPGSIMVNVPFVCGNRSWVKQSLKTPSIHTTLVNTNNIMYYYIMNIHDQYSVLIG